MKEKINPSSNEEELLFDKRIWTIEEVATFLNLSVKTIYNKTSRREIPYRKPKRGGRLYFLPDEILNWIDDGLR
tara:strand:+ start:276 stop:497 length:222 start_codon:yes stop_codon:yes gene_type:complete